MPDLLTACALLAVVLMATYVAIGVWALLLNELNVWASTVNQYAPYALFVAIVLIAAAMHLLGRHREHAAHNEHG